MAALESQSACLACHLLAEALREPVLEDRVRLEVRLADLVPDVIVPQTGEVLEAALHLGGGVCRSGKRVRGISH